MRMCSASEDEELQKAERKHKSDAKTAFLA